MFNSQLPLSQSSLDIKSENAYTSHHPMTCSEAEVHYSYDEEIKNLSSTYLWSQTEDMNGLRDFIGRVADGPLIAVGSGGSLTAAAFAAMLHESTGKPASFTTPLQLRYKEAILAGSSILLITAGGGNPDILECARFAMLGEPSRVGAICMKRNSRLGILAKRLPGCQAFEFDLPTGKDGFLATNSLMGTLGLLARAYQEALALPQKTLKRFLIPNAPRISPEALSRQTLVVLHAGWGTPAAMDLESKLVEASLANVQLADFRHFAHGRHHWLAKHVSDTAVAVLETRGIRTLAKKTLNLLPHTVPCFTLRSEFEGPRASLELLAQVMQVVAHFGHARGVNPGRPGVPAFGRKIYHLSTRTLLQREPKTEADVAVARKLQAPASMFLRHTITLWRRHHRSFVARLGQAMFGSVVLDYDGTLCDSGRRFLPLDPNIGTQIIRLVRSGLVVGVATGRGKSVRSALQHLLPRDMWGKILIGYYHAAMIAPLSDDDAPIVGAPSATLNTVLEALQTQQTIHHSATLEPRKTQITVTPANGWHDHLWQSTQDLLAGLGIPGVIAVASDHSFDILDTGVSKRDLVTACRNMATAQGKPRDCLCIGDMGRWPGNDCQLLSEPFSLSVDCVSQMAETCWNLLPAGCSGARGLIFYLNCLRTRGGKARFALKGGVRCKTE